LFTLDWAVTTPREEPKKQEPPKDPEGKVSPLRLLVVEDDAATLSVMVRLLRRDGHDVLPATSIKQALELAANHPFDLLISDLGLPDGSGNQLMQEIKLLQPCPGIALSGFGMDRDIKESKRAGFDAHIIKPVDLKRLRFLIATLSGNPSEGANSSLDS
jgi:CheY-like chemotaxis protein